MTGGATVYPFVTELVSRRLPAAGVVLEVGCGAMQYAPFLPGRYLGLDLPASNHLREPPHLVGSAAEIPLAGASVDVVFGVATFYYMDPIEKVFAECKRVLRPGGTLLAFDYRPHVTRALVAAGDHEVRHHWDSHDLKRLLREAGFTRPRDITHRATVDGVARGLRLPARLAKRVLLPRWTQWLIVEARA